MGKVLFLQVSVCSQGVPHHADWGVPPSSQWGGSRSSQQGVPLVGTGWGTPCQDRMGILPLLGLDGSIPPPPIRTGLDTPPTSDETEQHSEYLLRGGQYASCIHAGGLSCFIFILFCSIRHCIKEKQILQLHHMLKETEHRPFEQKDVAQSSVYT